MIADPVTTITLTAGAPQSVKFASNYPYYWIDNKTPSNIYARIGGTPVPDSDGTFTIAAGSQLRVSGGSFDNDIVLLGSGKVQIIASEIASCPFKFGSKGGGNEISGASSYSVDSVEYPLLGLNIFGRSVQDGTPTPDNPVDIVSVGDNGFDIISKDDSHFSLLSVRDSGGDIITKQPISVVGKNGETKQFIVSASGSGLSYQWWQNVNNGKGWVIMDASGARQPIFSIPVAAFRNGYKYRCVVTDSNGNSETSNEVTLYVVGDDCEVKTASIATDALPWCGIPVESGGNYTDSSGQQWICDELIYNADGTGKIVKRVNKTVFNGSENWRMTPDTKYAYFSPSTELKAKPTVSSYIKAVLLSNKYTAASASLFLGSGKMCMTFDSMGNLMISDERFINNINGLKADMASDNLVVVYALAEPQEIELTSAEISALKVLQTFDGTTSISNSADAEMSVKYCTSKALSKFALPIFNGMQMQIDELRAAVLSLGGNV